MLNAMMGNGDKHIATLRPYQEDATASIRKAWKDGNRLTLCCCPTGSGKSTIGGKIIHDEVKLGIRCLILCHTRKLARQFAHRVEEDWGIAASIEIASEEEDGSPVVAATVQTMSRRITQGKFHAEEFGLLVFDEAHLALSDSFQKVAQHFSKAKVLGLTATPLASGQRDLLQFFDNKSVDLRIDKLINEGYLAPLKYLNIPINIRVEKEAKTGDFKEGEIAHAITPYLASCADWMATDPYAVGRCQLAFLPLIETSREFVRLLRERGVKAEHVDGEMEEKEVEAIKKKLEIGEVTCVSCSMLWTIGIDIKPVSLILCLRLTESWVLANQIWGRGTRNFDPAKDGPIGTIWPKKEDCLLVDPLWLCDKHSLLKRPSCIFAKNEDEEQEMEAFMKKAGGGKPMDLLGSLGDVRHEREDRLRKRLAELAHRRERLVDAREFFMGKGDLEGAEYEPMSRWERDQITEGQRRILIQHEIDLQSVTGKGHASKLIDSIIERSKMGLATAKLCKQAQMSGMLDSYMRPKEDVHGFLNAIKNGSFEELPV